MKFIGKREWGGFGARRYWLLWAVTVPLLAWAVVRTLRLDGSSDLAPVMAFTPFAAIGAFLLFGLCIALRNWPAAAVAAIAFAMLAVAVLPRTFDHGEELSRNVTPFTVLSANLYLGRADPKNLIGLAARHRADLLLVQELTPRLATALQGDGIRRLLPYAAISLPRGGFNRAVYSRLPLRRLADAGTPPTAMPPLAVTFRGGQVVRLIDVHTRPPRPDRIAAWEDVLDKLPSAGSGPPWLLVGDFNATLDQAALRDVVDRGYRDAGEMTGMGLEMTWPNDTSLPPLVAIDHVLADRRLGIADYGVADLRGSDHRAIWAQLFLP